LDQVIEGLNAPHVVSDYRQAARIATAHLIELGHRHIVSFCEPLDTPMGRLRAAGFADAFAAAGLNFDRAWLVPTGDDQDSGAGAARAVLTGPDAPSAAIVRHTDAALGAIRVLEHSGRRVPEDCSILSTGDCNFADLLRVPLTTVRFPTVAVVAQGVQLLQSKLDGADVPAGVTYLPTVLQARASTGPVRPGRGAR
jgi:LacI family transcriptional regulator, repressor for deo operon, udp, cdd, tsx, nupC, and nupG